MMLCHAVPVRLSYRAPRYRPASASSSSRFSPSRGDDAHAPPGAHADRDHTRGASCRADRARGAPPDELPLPDNPSTPDDRPPQVRRRLPRRPRHRPRGDGGGEPCARRPRPRARLRVEELHPPFDTEALTRSGHLLPAATRAGDARARTRCSSPATPPRRSTGLKAALDLGARVTRVLDDTGEVTHVRPARRRAPPTGRSSARSPTARRPLGPADRRSAFPQSGRARVERHADRHPGVEVEHVPLLEALQPARRPGRPGVLVAEGVLGDAVAEAPRLGGRRRLVATGYLSPDGPGPLRAGAGHGERPRGAGRRRPEPDAARDRAAPLEGLGRVAAGRGARGEPRRGAPRRRGGRRRWRRRVSPRRPASSSTPCSGSCRAPAATRSSRWESGREDDRRRRDPPLARGRGRRGDVRHPRRGDHADVRRDGPRHDRAPRPRAPRAGRGPHGAGLRARVRHGRRRDRDLRPGRDEPRHADRRRLDGLDPARLHHGPGPLDADRHRRVPGVRHHRDHDADRQALVARPGRPRDPRDDEGRVPRRAHGPLRPGPRRRAARRPGGDARLRLPRRGRPAGLEAADEGASAPDPRGGARDRERAQARPLRRRRHAQRRRLRRARSSSPRPGRCPSSRR